MTASQKSQAYDELHTAIRSCVACTARQEAAAPVPGVGNYESGILFIGRNPGKMEDLDGRPFIGPAGAVLDGFLADCHLTRDDIYLTNLILCHTYKDRKPAAAEIKTCARLHLMKLLVIMKPFLVVTLGGEASEAVGNVKSISVNHGEATRHQSGFWMIPCLHPGAILHDPRYAHQLKYDSTQIRRFMVNKAEMLAKAQRA